MGDQPHSELSVTACLISLFINSQNICIINNLIIILIVRVIFQKLVPKQIEIAQFLIKLHQDIIRYNDINCQINFNFTKTPWPVRFFGSLTSEIFFGSIKM